MTDPSGKLITFEDAPCPSAGSEYVYVDVRGNVSERVGVLNTAIDRTTQQERVVYKVLEGGEGRAKVGDWVTCSRSQFASRFRKVDTQ